MYKNILIITILLSVMLACKKNENSAPTDNGLNIKTYVAAENGLVLRSAPDESSGVVANIPFKEEIIIIRYSDKDSKVNKMTAPWAFVRYKNHEGWLFSGYINGAKKGNYKNHNLEQLKSEVSRKYMATVKLPEAGDKTINTPDKISINEKSINGDLAVVWYEVGNECGFNEPSEESAPSLWYFQNGKWNHFDIVKKLGGSICAEVLSIKLVYINNDDLVDILVFAEINSGSIAAVFLNDGNSFNEVYDTSDFKNSEATIVSQGTCSTIFDYSYLENDKESGSTSQKRVRFNCRTNKFE